MANCTLVIPLTSAVHSTPCISLRLHRECLAAKSLFLRGIFSGAPPKDVIQSISPSRLHPSVPLHVPRSRLPRLLPSPSTHPTLFLPVPDPSSIQLLIEWMYHADTVHIQKALDQGDVEWQGLARNVEYLGLSIDIKIFLGNWYRNCLPTPFSPFDYDDDDDDDKSDYGSEYEDDEVDVYSSSSSTTDEEMEIDDDYDRGRTLSVKPIGPRTV